LGRSGNFVGSESGQKNSVRIWSPAQLNTDNTPTPPSHTLHCLSCTLTLGRGKGWGRWTREKVRGEIVQTFSFSSAKSLKKVLRRAKQHLKKFSQGIKDSKDAIFYKKNYLKICINKMVKEISSLLLLLINIMIVAFSLICV
jgi:hypothetical protein